MIDAARDMELTQTFGMGFLTGLLTAILTFIRIIKR